VRNHVTTHRNVIYIAAPPGNDGSVAFVDDWSRPHPKASTEGGAQPDSWIAKIDVEGVIPYLGAFYHDMEVRLLPTHLNFTAWEDSPTLRSIPKTKTRFVSKQPDIQAVGLSTGTEAIRVQVRRTPPPGSESLEIAYPFSHQLNLNDMTDVALSVLPVDAYALLLLITHELYESDEDDFCCGRAWGASRVAIVSSARYQPCLDAVHSVDRDHVWPASHCEEFVEKMRSAGHRGQILELQTGTKGLKVTHAFHSRTSSSLSPLKNAIEAHCTANSTASKSTVDPRSTFLLRLCQTAAHELGHCFGLDHCMYKACVMQGTASVAEDMRQPPYLCPVCDTKIAWAIVCKSGSGDYLTSELARGGRREQQHPTRSESREAELTSWKRERHVATKHFCKQYAGAFGPLLAWSTAFVEAFPSSGLESGSE
jgi:archaemetzincin